MVRCVCTQHFMSAIHSPTLAPSGGGRNREESSSVGGMCSLQMSHSGWIHPPPVSLYLSFDTCMYLPDISPLSYV